MGRSGQRHGLLVSALVHTIVIASLIRHVQTVPPRAVAPSEEPVTPRQRVFLPPRAALRDVIPRVPRPPAPAPPPRPEGRDRVSVGPRSELRSREPLVLDRDKDLSTAPAAPGTPGQPAGSPAPRAAAAPDVQPGPTASTPPATRTLEGPLAPPSQGERSITSSLRNLGERLGNRGAGGVGPVTGQQMGPLFFDPEGADFTAWINHFKNEVYRNWIVPQAVLLGYRGHVDLEFQVERDGTLSGLRLVKSSGTPALDRAAQNALLGSRFLPLPADYRPARVAMQVSFFYNEGPQG